MSFIKDENGQGMIEYVLIIALIALIAVVAFVLVGKAIKGKGNAVADKLTTEY